MNQKESKQCNSKEGVVLSNKMEKTVIVRVDKRIKHSLYGKVITKSNKYVAHTETPLEEGQKVTIVETRPLSKTKCWRVKSAS